jgi:hypothetical protein
MEVRFCEKCAEFCYQRHDLYEHEFKFGYCLCGYGVKNYHCFLQNPIDDDGDDDFPINVPR